MVGPGRDAAFPELLRHPLHLFPGGAVDDAAVLGMLGDELLQHRHFIGGAQHPERQVFPVESRDPDLRLPQGKMRQDVVPHSRRRRSGKGRQNWPTRELFHKGRDGHVGGPEVVPPLGHAVGLVHRDQRDLHRSGKLQKLFALQPFRRHIDDLVDPLPGVFQRKQILLPGQGAVEISAPDPGGLQSPNLILHQRNQGRDHQGDPREHQRRDLIAHGFARAGGHDAQGVPALQQRRDQRLLGRPEGLIPEMLIEQPPGLGHPLTLRHGGSL